MNLIHYNISSHVSNDTTDELETTLLNDSSTFKIAELNQLIYEFKFILFKIFRKAGVELYLSTSKKWKNPLTDKNHFFVVMMGLNEYKIRPYSILTKHGRSVFLFDAWPHDHLKISNLANQFKIDYLFVTASQAAQAIKPKLLKTKIFWIPEGINPFEYKQNIQLIDKQTDILAIGRKYDKYHDTIVNELEDRKYVYLYEEVKGKLIFESRNEFVAGLANAKISICIPSNITHPERAGNIETMTIRYLQSMVSKCIVLGHAPKEMIDLFGYNPVIEIDYNNPVEQIESILRSYADYKELIEKNYNEVINNHTWQCRWEQIKSIYAANSTN